MPQLSPVALSRSALLQAHTVSDEQDDQQSSRNEKKPDVQFRGLQPEVHYANVDEYLSRNQMLREEPEPAVELDDPAMLQDPADSVVSVKSPEEAVEALESAHARNLFAAVDPQTPSLVTNQNSVFLDQARVSVSPGDARSALVDLGGGAQIFIYARADGSQVAYRVENGELTTRIPDGEKVDLGHYRSATGGIDGAPVSLKVVSSSVELNEDFSQLSLTQQIPFSFNYGTDVYDIESGQLISHDGVPILDNMTTQQQFDYYADTPEGARILSVEGNFYTSDVEQRLLIARVRYARGEAGPEVFNEFTPRRASLSGDDLASYDAAVQDMMDEIREQGVYTRREEGTDNAEDLDMPVDESMLYLLASSAVEAYGESPEAMEAIREDISTWKISTDNFDGIRIVTDSGTSFSAGWYNGGSGTVQFNIESLVNDYTRPDDAFELVTHELAHSLDNVEQERPGFLDGIPPGLSTEDTELLVAERERLFELAYPDQDVDSSVNQDYNTVVDNSGFRNYAFYNRKEFWAELSATFLGSDAGAEVVRDASPELYNMLREYYGRDDLPVAILRS